MQKAPQVDKEHVDPALAARAVPAREKVQRAGQAQDQGQFPLGGPRSELDQQRHLRDGAAQPGPARVPADRCEQPHGLAALGALHGGLSEPSVAELDAL